MNKNKNEESFDVVGAFAIHSWENNKDDYKLIAESLEYWQPFNYALDTLNIVNKYVKDGYLFDGTVSNLKYLVKNDYLKIGAIDEYQVNSKPLKKLLNKYLEPSIDDYFDMLPDGISKKVIIEKHPDVIDLVLTRDDIRKLVEITGGNDEKLLKLMGLSKKNSLEAEEEMPMNPDRWSPQAMRCKLMMVGLNILNGFSILEEGAKIISSITEKDIQDVNEDKLVYINSIWSALGGAEWNKKKMMTFQELIRKDSCLMTIENSELGIIYNSFLREMTEKIAKKYFNNFDNKHPAYLAVLWAVLIILYRTSDYTHLGKRHSTLRFDGLTNKFFEYIFEESKPLKLQKWFIDYFEDELEKRIKFIKRIEKEEKLSIEVSGRRRIIYIPVFESFRFYFNPIQISLLGGLSEYFSNRKIPTKEKDEVLKNIVFNTQKIVVLPDENRDKFENSLKERFILLTILIFKPLIIKTAREQASSDIKEFIDTEDITSLLREELISMILEYDATKNSSFIGYVSSSLRQKSWSKIRKKKIDKQVLHIEPEEGKDIFDEIPSPEDISQQIESREMIEAVRKVLDSLSPKERAAIQKAFLQTEKLNEAERKAKLRGMARIKKTHPELKEFIR